MVLVNKTTNIQIADHLIIAENFLLKAKGLLGKISIPEDTALLLVSCRAVHTMFMKFPIDVVFLDKNFVVKKTVYNMVPWKTAYCKDSQYAIELSEGTVKTKRILLNDRLKIK